MGTGLKRLIEVESGVEAEMVCALLRQYGVRCTTGSAGIGGGSGAAGAVIGVAGQFVRDDLAPRAVLVHPDDLELARQVLAAPIDDTGS